MYYSNQQSEGLYYLCGLPGFSQKRIPTEDDFTEKNYKRMSKFSAKSGIIHRPNKCRKFTCKGQLELTEAI